MHLDITQQILHLGLIRHKLTIEFQQGEGDIQVVSVGVVVLLENPLEFLYGFLGELVDAFGGEGSQLLFGLCYVELTDANYI